MPCLELTTNAHVADEKKLLHTLSRCVCADLGKAETYMLVKITDDASMLFGGNDDPVAYLTLRAIGLKKEAMDALAQSLTEIMHVELNIESQRVYIVFMDADVSKWAWDGRTFA